MDIPLRDRQGWQERLQQVRFENDCRQQPVNFPARIHLGRTASNRHNRDEIVPEMLVGGAQLVAFRLRGLKACFSGQHFSNVDMAGFGFHGYNDTFDLGSS